METCRIQAKVDGVVKWKWDGNRELHGVVKWELENGKGNRKPTRTLKAEGNRVVNWELESGKGKQHKTKQNMSWMWL